MRTRWTACVAAAALTAFLPGCGGEDGGPTGGTSTQTGTGPTTNSTGGGTTTPNQGREVGGVIKVILADAFIQNAAAFDGDPIRAGQAVSTDDTGTVSFGLDQKIEECRLLPASKVVAAPTGVILLRWEAGSAWCYTTAGGSPSRLSGPSGVEFEMSDPLFGVVVEGQDVTLRVVQGIVDIDSPASEALLVGPGQQVTVVGGAVPPGAEDFNTEDLPQAEREIVSEFENAAPRPDFGPPDPGDSAGLQRILVTNGTINVGIDARFAGNPIEQTDTAEWSFVDGYFVLLSEHWGNGSSPTALTPDRATHLLDAGELDVFVAPEPLSGFGSFPLFEDPDGRTWSISFVGTDGRLGDALSDFVVATLQQKDYAIQYQNAFDIEDPPYEPLRPLLGL
jgi:hypothetical protein